MSEGSVLFLSAIGPATWRSYAANRGSRHAGEFFRQEQRSCYVASNCRSDGTATVCAESEEVQHRSSKSDSRRCEPNYTRSGATWRDQEHKKFVEDFEEHMKVIGRYVEVTNEHAPFLLRKADRIEEYLQQR